MSEKIYLYPVWIRLWHTLNAILIILLVITGISMQFTNPANPFIRFDIAVKMHNISGIILTLNYLVFLVGSFTTPNGRMKQFTYYTFGIFKHEKTPFPVTKDNKFNPLQQFTYVIAMFMLVPVVIITGWALLYPEVILTKFMGGSGLKVTDFFHVIIGFFISFFMFVHVYFCTIGATFVSNFKSMINGFHETH